MREEVGSEKGRGAQTDQILGSGCKDHQGIRLPRGPHLQHSLQGQSRSGNNEVRNNFTVTRSVQNSLVSCNPIRVSIIDGSGETTDARRKEF